MSGDSTSSKTSALLVIAAGGGIAGTLDLLQACILFGWRIPLVIAAGLLGRQALHGGVGTYILGVCLHFFIACSATATLRGQPQAAFLDRAPVSLRLVLWHRG